MMLLLAGASGEETPPRPAFFPQCVDFWGTRRKAPPAPAPIWDGDKPPPGPARQLLEDPTIESARRYLEWQRGRLERLQKALKALEAAKAERESEGILFFTREDCAYCRLQDRILGDLPVRRIRPEEAPELWQRYRVEATPTLVVRGKVYPGVTAREEIEKEVNR